MNDIEDRLRTAFETRAATVRPSPDAAPENRHRVRRVTRRRHTLVACAVASALAIAPLVALTADKGTFQRARPALEAPSPLVKAVGNPVQLTESPSPPISIPVAMASAPAVPVALASDGSFMALLGRELWLLGPSRGDGTRQAPVPVPTRATQADVNRPDRTIAYAMSPQARVFVDRRGAMTCVDASGSHATLYDPNSSGIWADGSNVVVRLRSGAVQLSGGCPASAIAGGRTQDNYDVLRSDGTTPIGLWGPRLTTVGYRGDVREYDLVFSRPTAVGFQQFPMTNLARLDDGTPAVYSASSTTANVWVSGGSLFTVEPRTSAVQAYARMPKALDAGKGGQLTVGSAVAAFTVTDPHGRVGSFVYDLRTGRQIIWPGRVFAAGDWLLWQDGENVRLARVR